MGFSAAGEPSTLSCLSPEATGETPPWSYCAIPSWYWVHSHHKHDGLAGDVWPMILRDDEVGVCVLIDTRARHQFGWRGFTYTERGTAGLGRGGVCILFASRIRARLTTSGTFSATGPLLGELDLVLEVLASTYWRLVVLVSQLLRR